MFASHAIAGLSFSAPRRNGPLPVPLPSPPPGAATMTDPIRTEVLVPMPIATARPPRRIVCFDRFDGGTEPGAVMQFHQNEAICKGEVARAQGSPPRSIWAAADAMESGVLEGQRNAALRQIMIGCMAGRSYRMTPVTVHL